MKIQTITTLLLLGAMAGTVTAGPFKRGGRLHGGEGRYDEGKKSAMREEAMLDKLDTHGPLGIWEREARPQDLKAYHTMTYRRIRGLLGTGALEEGQGTRFKQMHEKATAVYTDYRSDGEVTEEEAAELRAALDRINDGINEVMKAAEAGNTRTPILNWKQHVIEERIEFGERSGRLSKGEASRAKRKLKKIASIEERLKSGGLDTDEREKLHEEANELVRDLRRDLLD